MSIRARSSDELRNAREKGACCRNRRERLQSGRLGGAINTGPLSFVRYRTDGALSEGANRAAWQFRRGSRVGISPAPEDWLPHNAAGLIFPFPSAHL